MQTVIAFSKELRNALKYRAKVLSATRRDHAERLQAHVDVIAKLLDVTDWTSPADRRKVVNACNQAWVFLLSHDPDYVLDHLYGSRSARKRPKVA